MELADMRTIIEMAFEAGLVTNYGGREIASDKLLERFAALVAAAEREACAKLCEEVGVWPSLGPKHCAEAIRERGQA
jgi:hypothetical protein